jgi:hypothetical protein
MTFINIPEYIESDVLDNNFKQIELIYYNLYTQIQAIDPSLVVQMMSFPIIDKIIQGISQIKFSSIDALYFITRNEFKYDEYECEYIINKLDILNQNVFIERLYKLKNITKDNCKEELLKLLQKYYDKIDFTLLYNMFEYFNKESKNLDYIQQNIILYKFIQTTPEILNNVIFVDYFIQNISLHNALQLYLINTEQSERIFDSVKSNYIDIINEQLDRLLQYDVNNKELRKYFCINEFYNPKTKQYEDQTIYEIMENYKSVMENIQNKTGSVNKQKLMDKLMKKI